MVNLDKISKSFKEFAQFECLGSSEVYFHIASQTAQDQQLLEIAAHASSGQPIPNLFFGAVNFVLQEEKPNRLLEYYSGVRPVDAEDLFLAFREFVLNQDQEVVKLLTSRLVQTNEVNRCVYLFPVIGAISEFEQSRPLCLIELGAAAGLNLCCDKYRYEIDGLTFGDESSSLVLTSEYKTPFPFGAISPAIDIKRRIAVDINILDMSDDNDRKWMRALIWPEHEARLSRFDSAFEITKAESVEYVEGNAVALIDELISSIPKDLAICVFHTHVANQMSSDERASLVQSIENAATDRPIYHLYNNIDSPMLQLVYYPFGKRKHLPVAETEGHGRWVRWTTEPM